MNSRRRWQYAYQLGCDSVDGTCLTYAPDTNLARLRQWIASTTPHQHCRDPGHKDVQAA